MNTSAENLAYLAISCLPEHGRLRLQAGVVVIERGHYVRADGDLAGVLATRAEDEDLLIERFSNKWLVTFFKTFPGLTQDA